MKRTNFFYLFFSCFIISLNKSYIIKDINNTTTQIPPLIFTPSEQWQIMSVTVRISSSIDNIIIYYTLDGSIPTINSMIYSQLDPIFIDTIGLTTIKAIGHLDGYIDSEITEKTYNIVERCGKPIIIPNGGTFAGLTTVTITSSTLNTRFHYTIDGSTPTEFSTIATNGQILIDKSLTLKVIAARSGYAVSQVSSAQFNILPKVSNPIITPITDTFTISATLRITCSTPNATIYYTTNGQDPNEFSLRVDPLSPFIIIDTPGHHTVKAFGTLQSMLASDIVTKSFVILQRAISPTLFPLPGTYSGTINVEVKCSEDNTGHIYYTTDGITTPSSSSPHIDCGEKITLKGPGKYVIRLYRTADNKSPSAIIEGVYIMLRPAYDTYPINPNSTFQMKPHVNVYVVEKNLPVSSYSRSCPDRNIRGRLIVLHNPVGHFDIMEPLNGCGAGLVLPSISGQNLKNKINQRKTPSPTILSFYKNKIKNMNQEDLKKWNEEYQKEDSCNVITNAGFFNITSTACFGDIVTGGKVIQTSDLHNVNFGIRNGSFVIGYVDSSEIIGPQNNNDNNNNNNNWIGFDTLISGLVWLVRNGEVFVRESMYPQFGEGESMRPQTAGSQFDSLLSARTAIGYDKEGRLLILQVEGETWVRGMSLYEFAQFAKDLGFISAINLDGGGSATMTVNNTLVSEPSWKCSRVKALREYHQLLKKSINKKNSKIELEQTKYTENLINKWSLYEQKSFDIDIDTDGDGYRYCEKPVSSITCIHSLEPPIFLLNNSTKNNNNNNQDNNNNNNLLTQTPTILPTNLPSTNNPTNNPTLLPSQFTMNHNERTESPTLIPTHIPSPQFNIHEDQTKSPTLVNNTFSKVYLNLTSSLLFYQKTSYGLLIALLISLLFNFISICYCCTSNSKESQLTNQSNLSSNIEMTYKNQSSPSSSPPLSLSSSTNLPSQLQSQYKSPNDIPLSVPPSNWQNKFLGSSINFDDISDEEQHNINNKSNRSGDGNGNSNGKNSRNMYNKNNEDNNSNDDDDDETETVQLFKKPTNQPLINHSNRSSSSSSSSKSKSKNQKLEDTQNNSNNNWRLEGDNDNNDDNDNNKIKSSSLKNQEIKKTNSNSDKNNKNQEFNDGNQEYGQLTGWLKRKKKSNKKKHQTINNYDIEERESNKDKDQNGYDDIGDNNSDGESSSLIKSSDR